jgi:hypothetical protein
MAKVKMLGKRLSLNKNRKSLRKNRKSLRGGAKAPPKFVDKWMPILEWRLKALYWYHLNELGDSGLAFLIAEAIHQKDIKTIKEETTTLRDFTVPRTPLHKLLTDVDPKTQELPPLILGDVIPEIKDIPSNVE